MLSKVWHTVAQVGLTAFNIAAISSPYLPAPYNIIVSGGVSAVQAILAVAHHGTTDAQLAQIVAQVQSALAAINAAPVPKAPTPVPNATVQIAAQVQAK